MAKSELTLHIEKLLVKRLGRSEVGCKEVTIGWYGNEIVDFITVTANKAREIKCFEIKVSKADYHSKAHLTFIGHKNYFVMPDELYAELREDIIANYPYIGVYVYDRKYDYLVLAKKATLREFKADKEVIYTSMLRSMQREWFKAIADNKKLENEVDA